MSNMDEDEQNISEGDYYFFEVIDDYCPACGNWYEDVDYVDQVCSICGFDNN